MEETLLKLRILAKAETALMKANARRAAMRGRLFAMAIGLLLLTAIMLNVAAYQYLAETMTEAEAALVIALVNGVVAVLMILYAVRIKPGPEEAMAEDIRQMALTELSADADVIKDEFSRIRADVGNIKAGVSKALGLFKSGGSSPGPIGPALNLITSMLKR